MAYYCPMTQPSYGGSPYGDSNPYGAPPASPYGVGPYQSAPAYPGAAYEPPPAYPAAPAKPAKRSPVLGIIGFVLVVASGIAFYLCSYGLYDAILSFADFTSVQNGTWSTSMTDAQAQAVGLPGLGLLVSTVTGITGWVLSIVATAKRRGRALGIFGIVLGVLAPFTFLLAIWVVLVKYGVV